MTEFLDGPAQGTVLELGRAPRLLRAVRSPNGTWDALDQIDDEPNASERIVVYYLVSEPIRCHISCRPRSQSRWYESGKYRWLLDQPDDASIRTTEAWQAWCNANKAELESLPGIWLPHGRNQ